jgi:hypothetical protein
MTDNEVKQKIRAALKLRHPIILRCEVCEINIVTYRERGDDGILCLGCTDILWELEVNAKPSKQESDLH